MKLVYKGLKYIFDRDYRHLHDAYRGRYDMPDDEYIRQLWRRYFNKDLNLDTPQTFNEKMQWLKLFDRNPLYTSLVDKYEVKKYVSELIGDQYVIPTLGIYDSFKEIDFHKMPTQFVIKCTHDSGGLCICKDLEKFNIRHSKKVINKHLKKNYFYSYREWPYKNVPPRILIEKYMENSTGELQDYKVHNFNGTPRIILVCKDRFKQTGLTEDFFDTQWNHLDIRRPKHPLSKERIPRPKQLDQLLELSRKLSKGIPFVRTDFYIINEQVYFGEMTFYPASGFVPFVPNEWDKKLGEMLILPSTKRTDSLG